MGAPAWVGSDRATAIIPAIEVNSYNSSGRADTLRGNARHQAGAAGYVQHTLVLGEVGGVNQQRRPRSEDVPGGIALIEFGRFRRDLPLLLMAHLLPHPSFCDIRSAACVTALICSEAGDAGMCWIEPPMPTAPT